MVEETKCLSRWSVWRLAAGTVLLTLALAATVLTPSTSAATLAFGSKGSGAGQIDRALGLATDFVNNRLYVADQGNNRVDVFSTSGEFLFAFGWGVADGTTKALQSCGPMATPQSNTCFKGIEGSGSGQFTNPRFIAIDNDPASPAFHEIYVTDATSRVQRFNPQGTFVLAFGQGEISHQALLASGPGGAVYVSGPPLLKYTSSGTPLGKSTIPGPGLQGLGVAANETIYTAQSENLSSYKFSEPNAQFLGQLDSFPITGVAVSNKDHLFASQAFSGGRGVIPFFAEYDANGDILRRFGYDEVSTDRGGPAALDVAGNIFYVKWGGSEQILRFTPPSLGALSCCLESTSKNTGATIEGAVNPEGEPTTYHFDYIDQVGFESGGFSNPATKSTVESPVGSDFYLHYFEAQIGCSDPEFPPQSSCLTPSTQYHYRLVASNEDGKGEREGTFTTKPPFEVEETFSTDVGTDAARLQATVNPLGIAATAYFEYVDDAEYQADVAKGEGHDGFGPATQTPDVTGGQAPFNLGEGETGKAVAAQLSSLLPDTTYHYRIVVEDAFTGAAGPERTFSTFPVSSPASNSCPNSEFRIGSSSGLPDCRAYEMVSPVDKNGGDIKVLLTALNFPPRLEQSSTDGERFAYSSATAFGDAVSQPWTSEYLATRKEGAGWTTHAISPARESASLTSDISRFDVEYKAFSASLSQGWLLHDTDPPLDSCAQPGVLNLYQRDNETGEYEVLISNPYLGSSQGALPELQGVSADGTHAVFRTNGKLTKDAASNTAYQIYEHEKGDGCGTLRLVSVLPSGKASTLSGSVGTGGTIGEGRASIVSNAVSADGSRIFWTQGGQGGGALYARIDAKETLRISAENAFFWTAASDGSKVVYESGEGLDDLYVFDVDKGLAGEPASTLIAGGVQGVLGASEDASRIYFVSTNALSGEGAAGKPNLYLYEAGTGTRLIATLFAGNASLPGGDLDGSAPHGPFAVTGVAPLQTGVRVTPDGRHLAFVSAGSLTGYDNADATDGRPSLEVYLYDSGTATLVCASCNPTGARPRGRIIKVSNGVTRSVSAQMAPGENQLFFPRALTENGDRLFFESYEALLPRDTNGAKDVYEWQRAGGGAQCKEVGAELYVPSAGGCISLISSGQNPIDSELADASPDGHDVFIRTASSLSPQDPGLIDIYDARVNGGLPQPPAPVPACEGEACQGSLAPPDDPTPASAAFQGAGNVKEATAKKKAHKKKNRRQKKRHAKHGGRAGR